MRHRLEAISHMRSTVDAGGDNTPILGEELRQLPETMRTNTLQVAGITYNEVPELEAVARVDMEDTEPMENTTNAKIFLHYHGS